MDRPVGRLTVDWWAGWTEGQMETGQIAGHVKCWQGCTWMRGTETDGTITHCFHGVNEWIPHNTQIHRAMHAMACDAMQPVQTTKVMCGLAQQPIHPAVLSFPHFFVWANC